MRMCSGKALLLVAAGGVLVGLPRVSAQVAPAPVSVQQPGLEGIWQGTLRVGPAGLRVVFQVRRVSGGGYSAVLDSPDQGATGIPVNSIVLRDSSVELDVAAVMGRFEGRLAAGATRIDGVWMQGPGSLPLVLERIADHPAHPAERPQVPGPPFPYRVDDVRFRNEETGLDLAGTMTVPYGTGPFGGVVLVSGSGPQERDVTVAGHPMFLVLADHLTREGMAVLRYDKRGIGRSQGDFSQAAIPDFVSDAQAALAYLRSRLEVDAAHVGVVGHSEGAIVASIVGSEREGVAFVVLLTPPALPGDSILALQWAGMLRAAGESEAGVARVLAFNRQAYAIARTVADSAGARERLRALWREALVGPPADEPRPRGVTPENEDLFEAQLTPLLAPWARSFLSLDPRMWLRRLTVPTLALFGDRDFQVPAAENEPALEQALREAGNPDYTVRILPGLNHLLQHAETGHPSEYAGIQETFAPLALQLVGEWIRLRSRP